MLFPAPRLPDGALEAINRRTASFGLALTPAQAAALQRREQHALAQTGRVAFGGSALPRLAEAFSDSPFIQRDAWSETLGELTQLFYALKNETADALSDDELAARMAQAFNGPAQGDLTAMTDAFFMQADDREASDDDSGDWDEF